jgi:hypothetical protein
MKVTYRLPTDQYAYIEVTEDVSLETDATAIRLRYEEIKASFSNTPGIPRQDFNQFIDNQLNGSDNQMETYLAMSPAQQAVVQEIKKAIKRAEAKQ